MASQNTRRDIVLCPGERRTRPKQSDQHQPAYSLGCLFMTRSYRIIALPPTLVTKQGVVKVSVSS